jgi:hypothetical protein
MVSLPVFYWHFSLFRIVKVKVKLHLWTPWTHMEKWRYSPLITKLGTTSNSGQLHTPAALPPHKAPLIPTNKDAGPTPEPHWMVWRREKPTVLARYETPLDKHPAFYKLHCCEQQCYLFREKFYSRAHTRIFNSHNSFRIVVSSLCTFKYTRANGWNTC